MPGLAVELPPDTGATPHLLALDALERGDAIRAVALLTTAAESDRDSTAIRLDLARALVFAGRQEEALMEYDRVLARRPGRAEAHVERADLLVDLGRTGEAAEGYRRALALRPEHRHATHMLANIEGAASSETKYVAGLYDAYAAEFDEHLTSQLGYDIPAAIRQAVEGLLPRPVPALDLGCGTGFVADALQGRFSSMDGIDLSPAMLDRARRRKLYRELAVGDLAELVGKPPFGGPYGLVTAADVFIHVPDLKPVFAAVSASLTAGGLFAFSTEEAEAPVSLRSSGRFAHGTEHVRHLAAAHRFELVADIVVTIRLERLRPVPGRLFVLLKKTGGASA